MSKTGERPYIAPTPNADGSYNAPPPPLQGNSAPSGSPDYREGKGKIWRVSEAHSPGSYEWALPQAIFKSSLYNTININKVLL